MKRLLPILLILALVSCRKVPVGYSVCFNATLADDAVKAISFKGESGLNTFFNVDENVYIFNKTKSAMAYGDDGFYVFHPSDITNDGSSCTISGDGVYLYFTPEVSDEYILLYGQMDINKLTPSDSYYNYSRQSTGTEEQVSLFDFAIAQNVKPIISGWSLTVPSGVSLEPCQSIFRQHITLPDGAGTITSFTVHSKNGTLVQKYYPLHGTDADVYGDMALTSPSFVDGNVYLSLRFSYNANHTDEGDEVTFTAVTSTGTYTCTKAAPAGGFETGRYYYGELVFSKDSAE